MMIGLVSVEALAVAVLTLLTEFEVVVLSAGQAAAVMGVVTVAAGLFVRGRVSPVVSQPEDDLV